MRNGISMQRWIVSPRGTGLNRVPIQRRSKAFYPHRHVKSRRRSFEWDGLRASLWPATRPSCKCNDRGRYVSAWPTNASTDQIERRLLVLLLLLLLLLHCNVPTLLSRPRRRLSSLLTSTCPTPSLLARRRTKFHRSIFYEHRVYVQYVLSATRWLLILRDIRKFIYTTLFTVQGTAATKQLKKEKQQLTVRSGGHICPTV